MKEIKVNEELYDLSSKLFENLGLDMTNAVNVYLAACLRNGGIPFDIKFDMDCDCCYDDDCECYCGDCSFDDCNCEECDCDDDCDCDCGCNCKDKK